MLWACFGAHSAKNTALPSPDAYFLKDSIKLGEPVELILYYKHAPAVELFFPDSNYNFFPFEFISKKSFPSVTDSAFTTDSVIYTLTTFQLSPFPSISLPVYVLANGDTMKIYSNTAEVALVEILPSPTATDSLIAHTQWLHMPLAFNYTYWLIVACMLLALAGVVFIFFRKRIMRLYQRYIMSIEYTRFVKKFDGCTLNYNADNQLQHLEQLLIIWKKYMEKLEKMPFTTYTTKEIAAIINYNPLTSSLQNFDRAIYGGIINEDLTNSIAYLKETATNRYLTKKEAKDD